MADEKTPITISNKKLTASGLNGVLVVRIYCEEPKIDLERLIFLQPSKDKFANVEIKTDKTEYQPG